MRNSKIIEKVSCYLVLIIVVVLFTGCKKHLTINGESGFKIVISNLADSIEQRAAQQLQYYLFEMSGSALPIVEEDLFSGDNAIFIGRTNYAETKDVDFNQLKEDGYTFINRDNNFIIAGGSGKGVLYGVYELLEFLGFRKYTPDYTFIPKGNSIVLPREDFIFVPRVTFRRTNYANSRNPAYFDWHKLSSRRDTWGLWVHTFNDLLPPENYYQEHPEYYSLIDGKRLPFQLCLSNHEVADTVINNLRKRINESPDLKYWSVSHEDNESPCQCEFCKRLDEKYGGDSDRHSGSMIYFVNKIAREFPDKIISTLAYQYTRKAPENIKPEPNVNIMLCNIESERHKPVVQTDPAFSTDLENWGHLAHDILIWDYNVQFSNYLSPFPNLHTIEPNVKFYTANNVNAFYMQGCSREGGAMGDLKTYLMAKLLWNPDADADAIINDFVNGYYGDAGIYIRQYIDTMRHALLESNHQLKIFGSPQEAKNTYLSFEMMEEYKRLFDEAEKAVITKE